MVGGAYYLFSLMPLPKLMLENILNVICLP